MSSNSTKLSNRCKHNLEIPVKRCLTLFRQTGSLHRKDGIGRQRNVSIQVVIHEVGQIDNGRCIENISSLVISSESVRRIIKCYQENGGKRSFAIQVSRCLFVFILFCEDEHIMVNYYRLG